MFASCMRPCLEKYDPEYGQKVSMLDLRLVRGSSFGLAHSQMQVENDHLKMTFL